MPRKKAGNSGKRLTPEQRKEIANAPKDVTNTALAEKLGTSMATITYYRGKKKTRAKSKTKSKGKAMATPTLKVGSSRGAEQNTISMTADGDFLVLRIHRTRKNVVQGLVDQLLS